MESIVLHVNHTGLSTLYMSLRKHGHCNVTLKSDGASAVCLIDCWEREVNVEEST